MGYAHKTLLLLSNYQHTASSRAKLRLPLTYSLSIAASFVLCYGSHASPTQAQITPDGTLSTNVTTPDNLNFTINDGNRAGNNLFHSFRDFSVPSGGSAFFNNADNIQNIFSRVTGGSLSNIDGLIRANGTANLFLLNPNGILFGLNARLDISGSFFASTASSINFADGTHFGVANPQTTPLLTISVPTGLQFNSNPGSILVQGDGRGRRTTNDPPIDTNNALRVQPNQTLALIGGEVTLENGTLKTAGGRIELGSVADNGFVSLTPIPKGFELGYEGVPTFGDLQFSGTTAVDASGESGGDIQVQGRRITLTGGTQIEATTLDSQPGGRLLVTASESVELIGSGTAPGENRSRPSSISSDNRRAGQGGELTISTKRLIVRDGARISASNQGRGSGGSINVNASDSVELIGTGISPGGLRSSGLSVQTSQGTGQAGNLIVNTRQLIIRDGAELSASTFGPGDGGKVNVNASNSVQVIGTSATPAADGNPLRSRIVAEVGNPNEVSQGGGGGGGGGGSARATGGGGDLTIRTAQLTVRDGAIVNVGSKSSDSIRGAGSLAVTAQIIRLDNKGSIQAETQTGPGGNMTLEVRDLLLLRHQSNISTTAGNANTGGDGGNIVINTNNLVALENSDITANAFQGNGGQVTITAQGLFGAKSRTREELQTLLNTDDFTQFDANQLPSSDITAISRTGGAQIDGIVQINTPEVEPSTALIKLPQNFVDATGLIDRSCSPGNQLSSLIVTGRGGLPDGPDEPLSSEAFWEDLRSPVGGRRGDGEMGRWRDGEMGRRGDGEMGRNILLNPHSSLLTPYSSPLVEAQGWIINAKGEIVLMAAIPTATSYRPELMSVTCHVR